MSMTGGISFYERSKALYADGASAVASSNTTDQNLCLGTDKYLRWQSSGSDDLTTETLTITLAGTVEISRIFLMNHNLKAFSIKYGAGSGSDFSNVLGMDEYSDSKIEMTDCARSTSYFEFSPVTTDRIIITIDTTQTADAQKYLTQFIATNEIGTLAGYPQISGLGIDRNIQKEKAISGRSLIQKGYEVSSFDLTLKTYPLQADIGILETLHDMEESFLVWLCGGLPDQFRIKQRGFLPEDLYNMQIDAPLRNAYDKNIYLMGVNQSYSFMEVSQ